jgi:hypothetical protein
VITFPPNLAQGNPSDTTAQLVELVRAALLNSKAASGSIFGGLLQANEPNRLARTNGEWMGIGAAIATNKLVPAAGETLVVAVPVTPGDIISKVLVPIGATAGEKVEEGFAAIFEGKAAGKLLAQSKSKAFAEEFEKEKGFVFTLEAPVHVTAENAPGGFLYVQVSLNTVTVIATVVSVVGPTVAAAKAIANSGAGAPPAQFAAKTGAGLKTKAEAELGALVNIAYVPIVALF